MSFIGTHMGRVLSTGLMLLLCWNLKAQAQTPTQQRQLQQQAVQLRLQAQIKRAAAVQRARAADLPVRQKRGAGHSVLELQRFEHGTPVYYATQNETAAQTTAADKVWPSSSNGFSLTGTGVDIGLWDAAGVYLPHQEFASRAIQADGQQTTGDHATHVAGTLVAGGVEPKARGMAYQATLQAYNWTFDTSEMAEAAASGLRLSSHSYGETMGWVHGLFGDGKWVWLGDPDYSPTADYRFGFYNATAQEWDEVAHNAPHYLIVKAAGNDRGDGPPNSGEHWHRDPDTGNWVVASDDAHRRDGGSDGYDTIIDAGVSKNVLTVGAVQDVAGGYTEPEDVNMTAFSAWGPTDDGRIKPDVVANGTSVYSPVAASGAYASYTGTSVAAPNAAGSLALLLEHQQNLHGDTPLRAATLKTLALHTADEAGPAPGPDYQYGWGLINTLRAAQVMTRNAEAGGGFNVNERTLRDDQSLELTLTSDGTAPLKATIGWTDPAGALPDRGLNPRTPRLVNDLDARIIGPGGTAYQPWTLDPAAPSAPATPGDNVRDNVEQVLIADPAPGRYVVQISHKGALAGGEQPVSLIMTGAAPPTTGVVADAKLFLQGPFDEGHMRTTLNERGLLPHAQPYAGDAFRGTSLQYEGNERVPAGFFENHPEIVDWVLIELRSDPTTPVATRAALLRSDGTLADTDGRRTVTFSDVAPGRYYLVVHHRNHLPVMSARAVSLGATSVRYDFTGAQATSYGSAPMKKLNADVYGAWSGNVTPSEAIRYGGPRNDRLPILKKVGNRLTGTFDGYCREDVNMDGQVRYGGPQNDRLPILSNVDNRLTGTRNAQVPH